jgi:hypothetical protein
MPLSPHEIMRKAYKLVEGNPEYDATYVIPNNISSQDKGRIQDTANMIRLVRPIPPLEEMLASMSNGGSRKKRRRRRKTRSTKHTN